MTSFRKLLLPLTIFINAMPLMGWSQEVLLPQQHELDFTQEAKFVGFEGKTSEGLARGLEKSGGKLTIQSVGAKEGKQCLQWQWKAGDVIKFKIPKYESARANGPYANWRPCLMLWIYQEKALEQVLNIHAEMGGKIIGRQLPVSMNHQGSWRRNLFSYAYDLQVSHLKVADTVVLTAPKTGEGVMRFDLVCFELQYPRGEWVKPGQDEENLKKGNDLYQKVKKTFAVSKKNAPTPQEMARVDRIYQDVIAKPLGPKNQEEMLLKQNLEQMETIMRDRWLDRNWVTTYADEEQKAGLSSPTQTDLAKVQSLLERASALYSSLEEKSESKQRLGKTLIDFLRYAEFQLGPEFIMPTASVVRLADLLAENGMYRRYLVRCVANSEDLYSRITADDGMIRLQGNIEALGWGGGAFMGYLQAAYILRDKRSVAMVLRSIGEGINFAIYPASINGGYLDDGTVNHHGVVNWAYGSYCVPGLFNQLGKSYTKYGFLSAERLAYLKQVVMRTEAMSAGTQVPFAVRARWLAGDYRFKPQMLKEFALHGRVDGKIDLDAAGAYLNLVPEEAKKEPFVSLGIKARPVPAQTFTMPWSGLLIHRDDGFLATVKGFNHQVAAFEMQGSNRLARYLSHGLLQISNDPKGGDRLSFEASGFSFDGLDWNHLPGTTSKELPYDKLHKNLGRARSVEAFSGGVATRSRKGLYAMKLRDVVDKSFVARKSYFFVGSRIVCLGSDIASEDQEFPLHTTIFQKHLTSKDLAFQWNGEVVSSFPYEKRVDQAATSQTLLDPQGVGYFIPAGQSLQVRRSHQVSHEASSGDQLIGPSNEADYSCVWLDHGKGPKAGEYEYAVLINSEAAQLAEFQQAMKDPQLAPYEVLQKDTVAHVVRDRGTETTAFAIFEPNQELKGNGLIRVSTQAVLAIQEGAGKELTLTLCDPVLHVKPGTAHSEYESVETAVTLRGKWRLKTKHQGIKLTDRGDETEIRFQSTNAREVEVPLVKQEP